MAALLVIASFSLPAVPAASSAQDAAGRAVERGTDVPVAGAFVALENSAGLRVDAVVTDDGGRFRLEAPRAGPHRIRVQRIGFETWRSDVLRLADGATVSRRLEVPVRPVELSGVEAEVERKCRTRPTDAPETARLWREARKALEGAEWASEEQVLDVEVRRWRQRLTRDLAVVEQTSGTREGPSEDPFVSPPAEMLADEGYVREVGGGRHYFAPDESALLSETFQSTHCFWVERDDEADARSDRVGLAFRPTPDRGVPDIRGVIWLDRGTAELRDLEFRYVDDRLPPNSREAGGSVTYHRLPNGVWIVQSWVIRMPRVTREEVRIRNQIVSGAPQVRERRRVTGYDAEGGEVVSVRTPAGEELGLAARAVILGRVTESGTERPLEGAGVRLRGARVATRTDGDGRFRLETATPGRYTVAVRRGLAGFGRAGALREVDVDAGEAARIALTLPERGAVLEAACDGRTPDAPGRRTPRAHPPTAVVSGRVTEASGDPLPVVVADVPPGRRPVEVQHLDRAIRRADVHFPPADTIRPTFRLERSPVEVSDLRVEVERTPLSGKLEGFWRRKEVGMGEYLTREDLERTPGDDLSEVFRPVPGMRVKRCAPPPGSDRPPPGCYRLEVGRRPDRGLGGAACEVAVFLDGSRVRVHRGEGIDFVPKPDLEAVEVYTGPSGLPARYGGVERGCGAVMLWTRTGGR